MSITLQAYVSKSGLTAYMFALNGGALQYPTQVVTQPTFAVNGNVVQSQGPWWSPIRNQLPYVTYQLSCGTVSSIVIDNGGSGYVSPTATAPGCVLGTPAVISGVIISIPVTSGGSGFVNPPAVTVTDGTGSGAYVSAVLSGGVVTSLDVELGGSGYTSPTVTATGCVFGAAVLHNDVIVSIPVTSSTGTHAAPPVVTITDSSGTGASAVAMMSGPSSSDVVTYTGSAGWLVTSGGSAPAVTNGTVANYAGQPEPGIGGYLGFYVPPIDRSLEVGFGIDLPTSASYYTYNLSANWLHRGGNAWTNAVTSTFDGHPITITGTASVIFSNPNIGNGVDSQNYPTMDGVWTLVADEAAPGLSLTDMVPTITGSNCTGTGAGTLVAAGTLTSGVLVGRTWQWTIARTGGAWNLDLSLNVSTPGSVGTYPYTLSNEFLFSPPASAAAAPGYPSRANANLPDQSITNWLTTPNNRYAASLRFMDATAGFGGQSNVVDVADLRNASDFSWNEWYPQSLRPTGDRAITITTIRTYATVSTGWPAGWSVSWSSPNVYLAQWSNPTGVPIGAIQVTNGGGVANGGVNYTSPTATLSGGGGSGCVLGTPVVVSGVITSIPVTTAGSGYTSAPSVTITDSTGTLATAAARGLFSPADCSWLNFAGPGTQWYVGELVTSAPHNLASGQLISVSSGATSFNVSSGPLATYADHLGNAKGLQIYPTGPTTMVFTWIGSTTPGQPAASGIPGESMPGGMNNVAGSQAVSYTFELVTPDPGASSWETAAGTSASFPGCDHYVNVPPFATDATAAVIAARVRDVFPKGRRVFVEYSNENWNFAFSLLYTAQMGNLGAWGALGLLGNPNGYVLRAAQHHATFTNVFNATDINGNTNRGSEIVRVMGGWFTQTGRTTQIVACANAFNASVSGSIISIANATLWSTATTPGTIDVPDPHAYELGTKFEAAVAGFVTGARFYKSVNNKGSHVANLWSIGGTLLGSATYANETASGWQQVNFPTPIAIAANTIYIISYFCPQGHYSQDTGYFASALVNGNLTGVASSTSVNGVYNVGVSAFPATSFGGGQNYWADVVFSPSSSPTIVAVTPTQGSTGISNYTPTITATFDEPVQPLTITFTLVGGSSVSGTTTYNATTRTATFTPSVTLTGLTLFTATVSGAEDLSGNPMAASLSWTWTTLTPTPIQIDAVCVAPYMDVFNEVQADPATNLFGTLNSPVATVNPTGGGTSGGSLAAGTYRVAYSWIDSLTGTETGIGSSESAPFVVGLGNVPTLTLGYPTPNWTTSANIYLTPAGGASGSEVLYMTGVTATTINLMAANTGTVPYPTLSRLPSPQRAAASLASGHSTSIEYGSKTPWTRAAFLDWFRHGIKYNSHYSGPGGVFAGHLAALALYAPVGAQANGFVPALIGYEGGVEQAAPGGLETAAVGGFYLTNQISHDLYFDLEMYDCTMSVFQLCQQGGMTVFHPFTLCDVLSSFGGDSGASALWGFTTWAGMAAGKGDGSLDSHGNATTNVFWIDTGAAQHFHNASPQLQAWRDWVDSQGAPGTAAMATTERHDAVSGSSTVVNAVPGTIATTERHDTFAGSAAGTKSTATMTTIERGDRMATPRGYKAGKWYSGLRTTFRA
jgi:hypothetical protein